MIVYVAGPYESCGDVEDNVEHARQVAARLWAMGHAVICPHANTHALNSAATREQYLEGDRQMLTVCDAIVLLDGWDKSDGAREEEAAACRLGIPRYGEDDLPELQPAEQRCPVQVARHRELLGQLMRTHLDKAADYGPNAIRGMGELGVVVRVWDKVCRLLHLYGIRIDANLVGFGAPADARNEAIEDTWMDLSAYGLIGRMAREGVWGE